VCEVRLREIEEKNILANVIHYTKFGQILSNHEILPPLLLYLQYLIFTYTLHVVFAASLKVFDENDVDTTLTPPSVSEFSVLQVIAY